MTLISLMLLVPCFWHSHIEAGDLPSHVYNAWLAQLIEHGRAPGLYIGKRWNNILFDLALLRLGNWFGLAAAEKIAVSLCVLIFFWGAFSLVARLSGRAPWFLTPCLAMLAYGWTFNAGFFNYYLSLGIGFVVIALLWNVPTILDVSAGALLAALVFIAHPQGFAWLLGCFAYVVLWRRLPGEAKLLLPAAAAAGIVFARVYLSHHYETYSIVASTGKGLYLGSDQLSLYGLKSYALSGIALLLGVAFFVSGSIERWNSRQPWRELRLPLELYGVVVLATYLVPDVVRMPLYSGWIGFVGARLTTVSAILGLCVLGFLRPRKGFTLAFGVIAAVFFLFLYQDTSVLSRMEKQVDRLVAELPAGERVAATIWAPSTSRLPFQTHIVDRACIEKCFSFQNYEPASGEFRIRVKEGGSPLVSDDADITEQLEAGEYVVSAEDLPMAQIYQCDEADLSRLCIRQLSAGEVNGRLDYHPRPAEDSDAE